jgi:hypothetical protein
MKTTHYVVQDNSKNISLFSIYKDNNGVLWLGTHENGAYKFNGTTFEKFTKWHIKKKLFYTEMELPIPNSANPRVDNT